MGDVVDPRHDAECEGPQFLEVDVWEGFLEQLFQPANGKRVRMWAKKRRRRGRGNHLETGRKAQRSIILSTRLSRILREMVERLRPCRSRSSRMASKSVSPVPDSGSADEDEDEDDDEDEDVVASTRFMTPFASLIRLHL